MWAAWQWAGVNRILFDLGPIEFRREFSAGAKQKLP
jgi:hypothetical protein